jgi:hypothetical protein
MGNAQTALGSYPPNSTTFVPFSPGYPPTSAASLTQLEQLMDAIGYGIGVVAAHETGHQLHVPYMDCSSGSSVSCPEDYTYQDGAIGASNHEWSYGAVPGKQLHWTQDGMCAITRKLLGQSYQDKTCPPQN